MTSMDDLGADVTIRGFREGQRVFGRYTLQRVLGRGGMGVVWLARDEELERLTAIKFLPELIIMDPEALRDLKRETRRNLDITHANIVRIYDFEQDATGAGITMEYVEGDTLSALKAKSPNGCLDAETVAPWLVQICDALHYAHTKPKVAHRDLKPANIMLQKDGEIKVTDFGIASSISDTVSRVSMRAGSSGTPVFMSPQQAVGQRPTARDDIYSLGATIYDLLTGKPPFYTGQLMHQLEHVVPPLMRDRRMELEKSGMPIPEAWEEVVAACLAKNPEERPASVKEVGERLAWGLSSELVDQQMVEDSVTAPDSGAGTGGDWVPEPEQEAVTPEVLQEALGMVGEQEQPRAEEVRSRGRFGLWLGLAAVLALFLGVGWMLLPDLHKKLVKAGRGSPPSPGTEVAPAAAAEVQIAKPPTKSTSSPAAVVSEAPVVKVEDKPPAPVPAVVPPSPALAGPESFGLPDAFHVGWVGFSTRNAKGGGVQVVHVDLEGPGLGLVQKGDVILQVGGEVVQEGKAFRAKVETLPIGQKVVLAMARGNEILQVPIQVGDLRAASAQGIPSALLRAGSKWLEGEGLPKDDMAGANFIKRAAEKGYVPAQYRYGRWLEERNDLVEAFAWISKAAMQGHAEAQNSMGVAAERGKGTEKNPAAAERWYRMAAEQDEPYGQDNLGDMLYNGAGVAKNLPEAARWYRMAAEQNHTEGMFHWGFVLWKGEGVTKDAKTGTEWMARAADKGHGNAAFHLAVAYSEGNGVARDQARARALYEKAAEKGVGMALNNLGWFCEVGEGGAKDPVAGLGYYKKAAEKGIALAQRNLGRCLLEGIGGPKNLAEAVTWYRKSAEGGDITAQEMMMRFYVNGEGVAKSMEEALRWARKAAEAGSAGGACTLGLAYANGDGVAQNWKQAATWLSKSAEKGNATAQYNLGYIYHNGLGVAKDLARARDLYNKAASQGEGMAMNNLAQMYSNGWGVPRDHAQAMAWFKKGSAAGNSVCDFNIGTMYWNGEGRPVNHAEATRWFKKAAAAGSPDAKRILREKGLQ